MVFITKNDMQKMSQKICQAMLYLLFLNYIKNVRIKQLTGNRFTKFNLDFV
ncbi:MAG: hypothetical protein BAJALOKI1v1_2530004 [Promethearchaeota archaeon]|nr:MAG: hypothetical protein BAJALOKI1v1_2530004 [Candidatus Lokiarchaeota archaeon]